MAPEVFLHEPYNTKVDVYSFAMIMYQLFEGRVPFDGTDPVQAAKNAAMHKQRPLFTPLQSNAYEKATKEVRADRQAREQVVARTLLASTRYKGRHSTCLRKAIPDVRSICWRQRSADLLQRRTACAQSAARIVYQAWSGVFGLPLARTCGKCSLGCRSYGSSSKTAGAIEYTRAPTSLTSSVSSRQRWTPWAHARQGRSSSTAAAVLTAARCSSARAYMHASRSLFLVHVECCVPAAEQKRGRKRVSSAALFFD